MAPRGLGSTQKVESLPGCVGVEQHQEELNGRVAGTMNLVCVGGGGAAPPASSGHTTSGEAALP